MIHPVRTGYLQRQSLWLNQYGEDAFTCGSMVLTNAVGQDYLIDPKLLRPSAEELFPNVVVTQTFAPSPDGPLRCEVFRLEGATPNLPAMMYLHGGASWSAGRRTRNF